MKVTLSPAAEDLVRKSLECGLAASPDQAVERALAIATYADEQHAAWLDSLTDEEIAELNEAARVGIADIEAGRVRDYDEVIAAARALVAAKAAQRP